MTLLIERNNQSAYCKSMKTNKELFLFDFDGLLVNTEEIYAQGWIHALKQEGKTISKNQLSKWCGQSSSATRQDFEQLFPEPGFYEKIYQKREEFIYCSLENGNLHLLPYAKEALSAIQKAHKKSRLVTGSKRKRVLDILSHFQIERFFDQIICDDDIHSSKPDPEGYLLALKGFMRSEAIAFEDSITGLLAAKRAGIEALQIPSPDYATLECVLEYLKK